MSETYAGWLARMLPELDGRELHALASENHWHEVPGRYGAENRRTALSAIRVRAEDSRVPEQYR
jgi:hypothetical protein